MKKTSRILALLLSLVAVFSLFGCGSKDADGDSSDDNTVYTISWAHSSSTNDRLALATEKMAAELEEASGGRLKIEHYPPLSLARSARSLRVSLLAPLTAASFPPAWSQASATLFMLPTCPT